LKLLVELNEVVERSELSLGAIVFHPSPRPENVSVETRRGVAALETIGCTFDALVEPPERERVEPPKSFEVE
jgi:hypothetical protein